VPCWPRSPNRLTSNCLWSSPRRLWRGQMLGRIGAAPGSNHGRIGSVSVVVPLQPRLGVTDIGPKGGPKRRPASLVGR
jgi:hypothetical protein